jgi:Icc-related predicted phosphoesterase
MSGNVTATTQPPEDTSVQRDVVIAAVGDLLVDESTRGALVDVFANINERANYLVICGDMTTHGRPEQMKAFVEELRGIEIPIVAVLGNHDYEGEAVAECTAVLRDRGIHVLEGDFAIFEGIGFAGVKGFCGGFGRGSLAPFGERLIKDFVQSAIDDALNLENAMRSLSTAVKVAVLHYSPIVDTIKGEPEIIYPFLGSSRLLQPIETYDADVVFHGHAHHGTFEGRTPKGIPVYNVALPVLRAQQQTSVHMWSVRVPDRRKR